MKLWFLTCLQVRVSIVMLAPSCYAVLFLDVRVLSDENLTDKRTADNTDSSQQQQQQSAAAARVARVAGVEKVGVGAAGVALP